MEISGVIESGAGKGAYFTQVDWVVEQCENKLQMTPFPGTLNIRINDETVQVLGEFLRVADVELVPNDPSFCAARVKKVAVNGVPAAVVLPSEDVRIHDNRTIELIASCNLKKRLGLDDGDTVTISCS
jgi:riboflavin kinase, archaea type